MTGEDFDTIPVISESQPSFWPPLSLRSPFAAPAIFCPGEVGGGKPIQLRASLGFPGSPVSLSGLPEAFGASLEIPGLYPKTAR